MASDNGISDKSYYYWLRKIRLEAYEQLNVPAVTQSAEVSFAEIHFQPMKIILRIGNESVSTPVNFVIKCGNLSIGLSNDISRRAFYTDFLRRHHMLEDVAKIRRVVLACGMVDHSEKGIDGLATIIGDRYRQNPFEKEFYFVGDV
ncbi:MAG: hypothetical protein ACLTLQ_21925 [[Clostridium] scindens]